MTCPDIVRRARAALELVHDPTVHALKFARPSSPAAAAELERQCVAMVRHAWHLVAKAYGVTKTAAWAVHPVGDPLNCLALAPSKHAAEDIRAWWPGKPVVVSKVVTNGQQPPETYIAMAVALHWKPPAWLVSLPPPPPPTAQHVRVPGT